MLFPDAFVQRTARFGYATKGVVYLLVGLLAARAAWDVQSATGSEGAIRTLLQQPFGRILVTIVAVGLAGYAFWRFVQAIENPEDSGWLSRTYALASGLLHTGLMLTSLRMAGWLGGGGGGKGAIAKLMEQPFGRWLVCALGLVVIGVGVRQLHKAWTEDFREQLSLGRMAQKTRHLFVRSAQWALTARGVVFGTIGVLTFLAGWHADPSKAESTSGALQTLESQAYGSWLLAFIAVGLTLYGVYQLVKAKYRRFDT